MGEVLLLQVSERGAGVSEGSREKTDGEEEPPCSHTATPNQEEEERRPQERLGTTEGP